MSEQIQNFATLNPFDEKIIDDSNSSSNVANGKSSVPSKIRKCLAPNFLYPLFPLLLFI